MQGVGVGRRGLAREIFPQLVVYTVVSILFLLFVIREDCCLVTKSYPTLLQPHGL